MQSTKCLKIVVSLVVVIKTGKIIIGCSCIFCALFGTKKYFSQIIFPHRYGYLL